MRLLWRSQLPLPMLKDKIIALTSVLHSAEESNFHDIVVVHNLDSQSKKDLRPEMLHV